MKFQFFTKKTQPQSAFMQVKTGTSNKMTAIEELKKEEFSSIAGAPQMENDPLPG